MWVFLTFKKKSPTVQEVDCGATGFYGFFVLEREHEETCSAIDILLILSGMSTNK
jgi:hypothetical protein